MDFPLTHTFTTGHIFERESLMTLVALVIAQKAPSHLHRGGTRPIKGATRVTSNQCFPILHAFKNNGLGTNLVLTDTEAILPYRFEYVFKTIVADSTGEYGH